MPSFSLQGSRVYTRGYKPSKWRTYSPRTPSSQDPVSEYRLLFEQISGEMPSWIDEGGYGVSAGDLDWVRSMANPPSDYKYDVRDLARAARVERAVARDISSGDSNFNVKTLSKLAQARSKIAKGIVGLPPSTQASTGRVQVRLAAETPAAPVGITQNEKQLFERIAEEMPHWMEQGGYRLNVGDLNWTRLMIAPPEDYKYNVTDLARIARVRRAVARGISQGSVNLNATDLARLEQVNRGIARTIAGLQESPAPATSQEQTMSQESGQAAILRKHAEQFRRTGRISR